MSNSCHVSEFAAASQLTEIEVVRFGERVREVRKSKGITLRAAAEAAGLAQSTLSQIERGYERRENVKIATLARIAAALDVTPGELLDGVDEFPGD